MIGGPSRPFDRVIARRYWLFAITALAAGVVAGGRGDWNVFVEAGRALVGRDGVHVFVQHRDIQTGPLTLLAARFFAPTPRNGFVLAAIVSSALGLGAIRLVEHMSCGAGRDRRGTLLVGGIVTMFWWAKLGGYGHLDDAVVLASAVAALAAVRRGRTITAGLLLGVAMGFKPWAVILLPITLVGRAPLRDALRPVVLSLLTAALVWAPFLGGAPDTIGSMRATVSVAYDSVIHLFGVTDASLPGWLRTAQLSAALAIAVVAARRRSAAGVLLAAIAVRLATDPGTWSYYTAGIVLGALVWDLLETQSRLPLTTLVASVLVLPAWIVPWENTRAWMRLLACAGAVALVLRRAPAERVRSADDLDAQPVLVP